MDRIPSEIHLRLETALRQLSTVYLYLRDHDLGETSNTSRLLHEKKHSYLVSRLADELQELAEVQSGEHIHTGKHDDTVLEGSQVCYWLFLLAITNDLNFDDFAPHQALLKGYCSQYGAEVAVELHQECLQFLAGNQILQIKQGLKAGFAYVGWACAAAKVSPLAPAEFDLAQMRHKGILV